MRTNRLIIILGIFFCCSGFTNPKQPQSPQTPSNQEENKPAKTMPYFVRAAFSLQHTQFTGQLYLPTFKLTLVTQKDGFSFYKELTQADFKSITVKKWQGFPYQKVKKIFYPIEYEIVDHYQVRFTYHKNIPELNLLTFETTYGKTKLFSYYVDQFDKIWLSTGRKDPSEVTGQAPERVLTAIEFLAPLPEQIPAKESTHEPKPKKP
ncbi:MAG: hypothetical protein CVV50_01015 [Spirochaetae bacterium HGW-Spirochaetae-6]|nr:MAG: hypothetical protein CVV50_01015 [Spirochaetae bacterium HGW-Spirochaetae-6]